jgi:hypothetical protein
MDLKDQVISLEYAKHLKELGVKQKSLFYWEYFNENAYSVIFVTYTACPRDIEPLQHFSAFTSDELIDLLPCYIDTKRDEPFNSFWLEIHKRVAKNIQYCVKYICDTAGMDRFGNLSSVAFGNRNIHDENLSNALAKMLIYLINENIYVKVNPIDTSNL